MALNGVFYGTTNNQFIKPKIEWSAVQSQEGNYSDVTATLFYSRTNEGYVTASDWYGSITIDGTVLSGNKYVSISYNSNTKAITNTVRVYHDNYGQKRITISADGYTYGTTHTSTSISQEIELDTIARESTIGASDGYIGSAVTVSVKQRNPAYTHSVAWQFGALSGFIGADWTLVEQEEMLTDTSISMQLPESFYMQIQNAREGVCTLTCRTYAGNVQIGTEKVCRFRVMTRESECAPIVTGTVVDINEKTLALTGDENILIRGFSTAFCTMAATARNGAAIVKKQIAGVDVEENALILEAFDGNTVLFTAADSREYPGKYSCPVQQIPYVKLSMVLSCQRMDPTSGNCRLTLSGQYYSGSFGAQENSLSVTCRVNSEDPIELTPELTETGYKLTAVLSGLEYTDSHKVTVTVMDKLMSVSQSITVQKGIPVFDWGANDFAFHVPVTTEKGIVLNGKDLCDLLVPPGYVFTWDPVEDPSVDLSTAEKVAEHFGFGTWEQITDTFLLAAGEKYEAGSIGGSDTHTLTVEEMPSHSHQGNVRRNSDGHDAGGVTDVRALDDAGAAPNHETLTLETGGGQAFSIMPPYRSLYVWKRIK